MGKPFLTEWPDVEPGDLAILVYDGSHYVAFMGQQDLLTTPSIWQKYADKIKYALDHADPLPA